MSCRQPEKILFPPQLAVLLAEPVELLALRSGEQAAINGPGLPRSIRACRTQLVRELEGMFSLRAISLQGMVSLRQRSTASAFCSGVNRRLRLMVGSFMVSSLTG